MLLLTFRAADNLYAINVARVVEVVPRINLRQLPHAPSFLTGVFDYRGKVVPVVDLGVLLGSQNCRDRLSTRIILVNSHPDALAQPGETVETTCTDHQDTAITGQSRRDKQPRKQPRWVLGLIAELVSDVCSVQPEQVISSSIELPQTPYLGAIAEIEHEMAQLIAVDRILELPLRRSFFGTESADDRKPILKEM